MDKPPDLRALRKQLGFEYTIQEFSDGSVRISPPAGSKEEVVNEASLEDALFQALGRKFHVSPYWLKMVDDCARNRRNKVIHHVG